MPATEHLSSPFRGAEERPAPRTKWEYKIILLPGSAGMERLLNQLGSEGWELVFKDGFTLGLKRPR